MKRSKFACLLVLLLLVVAGSGLVAAQTGNTGVIIGIVTDQTGAVIPGATVRARNRNTGAFRETTTTHTGVYELVHLAPGEYRVEIEWTGFVVFVQEPIIVNVFSRISVSAELQPLGVGERITVTADMPPLIETDRTDVSGIVSKSEMENFPVNGRSFASLAMLVPGVKPQPSFDPVKARTGTFSIGGSTGRNVNITVDGGDNKDNHVGGALQNFTMEGLEEFALATQRFSAANGRSGGALLAIITKGGTNQLHGSGFAFFRDDRINASAPALLATGNPGLFDKEDVIKPRFDRQQFGGSAGGPLIKSRAFWFGTLEHTRERGNSIVPSFAFKQISKLEPLGYKAVRFLPQPFDETKFLARGDFNPNNDHAFVVRYAGQQNRSRNDQAGFLTVFTDLSGGNKHSSDSNSLLGSWTWIIDPKMVNSLLYQWSTFNDQLTPTSSLPLLLFPDGITAGQSGHLPERTFQRKHQFRDDLTWNRGNHGFKVGADFVLEPAIGGFDAAGSTPTYRFNFTIDEIVNNPDQFPKGLFTSQVSPGPITGSPDKVKGGGVVGEISLAGGDPGFGLRDGAKQFSWYLQDDWKLHRRLALNLGIRYDVDIGFLASSQLKDNRVFKLFQMIRHPLGSRIVRDDKNNFSPRVGFAWDVKGDGRSVIRGGYGLYYDESFLDVPLHSIQQANAEIFALIVNNGQNLSLASAPPVFPKPLTNPPFGFGEIATGDLLDPSLTSPYTQQMNFGFSRAITTHTAIAIDYVHILGLHEFTLQDANPRIGPLEGANRDTANPPRLLDRVFAAHRDQIVAAFGQPVPFGQILITQSDGRSRYDALTVSFRKSYSRHIQLTAHYTLSRAVAWFGRIADFEIGPQNPFNKFDAKAEFGHPGEDERHAFLVGGIFDLPRGFQVSSILRLASARPYSIFPNPGSGGGGDINRDGNFNDRESRDGNDQNHLPPGTARGDNFFQVDLRISKFLDFREHRRLALYFEAFNLFNTANFGNSYDGTFGSPNFRKPLSFFGATGFSEPLGIPLQGQLGIRFSF
jgi:hypothetical protein